MATQTLTISLSSATLDELQQSGFQLYAFQAVTSSNKSGVPLVWARVDSYLATITLTFDAGALSAYISTDGIAVDSAITVGASTAVAAGQIVSVAGDGTLTVASGAPSGDIYIASSATTAYTCGLAAALGQSPQQPICAFTLYPQVTVTMQPADAIVVMWATSTYDPGVYMQQSLGPGFFIDFNGATQRAVSYDMSQGWSASGAAWAKTIPSGTNLAAALILDPGHNQPMF